MRTCTLHGIDSDIMRLNVSYVYTLEVVIAKTGQVFGNHGLEWKVLLSFDTGQEELREEVLPPEEVTGFTVRRPALKHFMWPLCN